ncbi:MAG: hypothetical protein GY854_19470 [Deltaproteobacteria bacterium]|nr:hypothetical protein [Deltaproteobacteria bacterium]
MKKVYRSHEFVLFIFVCLMSGCSHIVPSAATTNNPHKMEICERQPLSNHDYADPAYHAFISMLDSMISLQWKILEIDEEEYKIKGQTCTTASCWDIFVQIQSTDEVAFYFSPEGYQNWENNIVDRFNDVSCGNDQMIEERIGKEGFSFSKKETSSKSETELPDETETPQTGNSDTKTATEAAPNE